MSYYKLRQVYYKLQQNIIRNYGSFITIYDSALLQITAALLQITAICCYKLRQLYQIITNYGSFWCYSKLRQHIITVGSTIYDVIRNYVVTERTVITKRRQLGDSELPQLRIV